MSAVIVSYPKSGRTWLRVILEMLAVELDYIHAGASLAEGIRFCDLKVLPLAKPLLMVRNPLDTVASCYFQATKRLKIYDGTMSDFIQDERYGLEKINYFHSLWKDIPVVRYEDMHDSSYSVVLDVLNEIGLFIPTSRIVHAHKFTSFE
jgi:hypothetical protein